MFFEASNILYCCHAEEHPNFLYNLQHTQKHLSASHAKEFKIVWAIFTSGTVVLSPCPLENCPELSFFDVEGVPHVLDLDPGIAPG